MQHQYDFWNQFHPQVWLITKRETAFWEEMNYAFGEFCKIHKLSIVCGGSGRLVYNSEETALTPGMVVYSSPGNEIHFLSSRQDPLHFYSVMFHYALICWEGWNSPSLLAENDGHKLPLPSFSALRHANAATVILRHMHTSWNSKKVGYEWKVNLAFKNLLSEVLSQQIRSKGDEEAALALVNKVIAYINERYPEKLDRKAMADYVSLSHSYLSLLFKKYTGWSPVQYLIKIRMDKAKELLRDSRKSIGEIAVEVGYADPLYFSRVFAQHTGLAPKAYRKG